MLMYLLSKLVHLFLKVRYGIPYLQYLLPVVLFITRGNWARVIMLLYFVTLAYDTIELLVVELIWYLYSALPSPPYFGSRLSETINNYTLYLFSSESQATGETYFFSFPFSSRQITVALENFEYPWDVQTSMFLLLCLLNVFQVLSKVKQSFKNTFRKSAPRLNSRGWHGVWENMGRYLESFSPPMVWNFTPEQLQDPDKVTDYLKGKCCGDSKEAQLIALCWALASIYQTLLDTVQHPQGEGRENRPTDTAATPTPATDTAATATPATGKAATPAPTTDTVATPTPATSTAATPTPATSTAATPTPTTGTAATPTPATGAAAEPENQPVPVAVAPIQKKKYTKKSVRLTKDEDEPGPSREQEEEAEPEVITRSLSLSELRDMRKDFSRRPGEHIITWLLRCWDNGASSLELEGREAKQLGSLAREGGIDKAIGKGTQALSLWRRLLSSVKERYPFKEDVICQPGKWTTMERGIQYLRELAVLEMIYYDPDSLQLPRDPDEVQCTRPMWRKFVRSAPSSYANPLAVLTWKDEEAPTVDEMARQLRQYEENLSSSLRACVSAVEKLSEKSEKLIELIEKSYSPPVQTNISAIRSEHSSDQEREYRRYTPRGTLWFYLRDHGEDMRKWDRKPTSVLDARVRELKGKTTRKGDSSRKDAAPVSRQSRRASDPLEGTSKSFLQEVSNKYSDQD